MRFIGTWRFLGAGLALAVGLRAASFNVPPAASLSLTSAPGGMRVVYKGATNFKYQVQVSSNLATWSLLASNVATNRATAIIDASSTNRPMRFYKASSLVTPFFYQGTFSGSENGSFILLARTNNTTVFMALNLTTGHKRGEYATNVVIAADDSACGTFIVGAPGCLEFTVSNTIAGRFTNSSSATGIFAGVQKSNLGSFSGYAGVYSGNVSAPHGGPARILLCPDGSFAFYRSDPAFGTKDGGIDVLPAVGPATLDVYLSGSGTMHVQGTFNKSTKVFSLQLHELDQTLSTVTLTFTEPVF